MGGAGLQHNPAHFQMKRAHRMRPFLKIYHTVIILLVSFSQPSLIKLRCMLYMTAEEWHSTDSRIVNA